MRFILLPALLVVLLFIQLSATPPPDTTGFIDSLSRGNVGNPIEGWQESWFDGAWFNLSFTDNFAFTYRFYGYKAPPPDESLIENRAFGAAVGNLHTTYLGPEFLLLGYVVEDETWCILPAVLSPQYVTARAPLNHHRRYTVDAIWYSCRAFWQHHPPVYRHEETYADHNLTIWARLPANKQVEVWWGADAFAHWETYRQGDLITARNIEVFTPFIGDPPVCYEDWDDYRAGGSGLWQPLGEFTIDGPEPPPGVEPPGWAECTFLGRVQRNGSSGENWLPAPGSEIGLAFKFQRTQVPATATIGYNIYNISTWQGECMNYPDDAPQPRATGTGEFFDFIAVDTARYDDIDTMDFDLYNEIGSDSQPEAVNIYSIRRLVLILNRDFAPNQTVIKDTLWLKARDYGAKAMVCPVTGSTWRDLKKQHTSAFGQHLWSVSVPRDDDGQAFPGYNWGDFIADAWEEQVLGLPSPSGDSAVVRFTPFYQYEDDILHYSDRDSLPVGRNIKGDGFCNWEEYRGFITVGDQFGFYPQPNNKKHKRLNPFFKNVMVHFMPNAECRPWAPGWMSALPDTMAYLVDHLTSLEDTDSCRLLVGKRYVSINLFGASYPYYSSSDFYNYPDQNKTTKRPASKAYQNAVVFWPMYRGRESRLTPSANALGYCKGPRFAFNDSCFVPNIVRQTVVMLDSINALRDALAYYNGAGKDSAWNADRTKLTKFVIAHELGHCIGMTHDILTYQYNMARTFSVDPSNQNKLILDPPLFLRIYSPQSHSEISIKER